jgi:hypothetical protein
MSALISSRARLDDLVASAADSIEAALDISSSPDECARRRLLVIDRMGDVRLSLILTLRATIVSCQEGSLSGFRLRRK